MAATDHRSSSPDSLFVSQHRSTPLDDHYRHESHDSQRRRLNNHLALPTRRPSHFVGDGFDFRRPVMATAGASGARADTTDHWSAAAGAASTNIIDLTEEDDSRHLDHFSATATGSTRAQRPPRFGRDIIDVEGEGDEESGIESVPSQPSFSDLLPPRGHRNPTLHHPRYSVLRRPQRLSQLSNSVLDEVEFLEERPRSRLHTSSRSHTPAPRSMTPYPTGLMEPIDLTGDNDDDVVHLDTRTRPVGVNQDRPAITGGVGTRSIPDATIHGITGLLGRTAGGRLLARIEDFMGGGDGPDRLRAQQEEIERLTHLHNARNPALHRHRHTFMPPPMLIAALDYETPAFDLGLRGGNAPSAHKYEPPEPAADGFTRNPEENEEVVCPNCGDELAMGDTETKQEIWVIKKCGHAYCGDCARNRTKAVRGKSKGKGKAAAVQDGPPIFKHCVVDKCKESTGAKSWVHVYLGS